MRYINKNGHKNIQIRAMQIQNEQKYKLMTEDEKIIYVKE